MHPEGRRPLKLGEVVVMAIMFGITGYLGVSAGMQARPPTDIECRQDALFVMCQYYGDRPYATDMILPGNGSFTVVCGGTPAESSVKWSTHDYIQKHNSWLNSNISLWVNQSNATV